MQLELGCHVVVPVNCELKRDGSLVMGAGLAKALANMYPALPGVFGLLFSEVGAGVYETKCSFYDAASVGSFISFPTKTLWREPARYDLVKESLIGLCRLVDRERLSGVFVPKVGCGLGGLDWGVVSDLFDQILDERFIVPLKGTND